MPNLNMDSQGRGIGTREGRFEEEICIHSYNRNSEPGISKLLCEEHDTDALT